MTLLNRISVCFVLGLTAGLAVLIAVTTLSPVPLHPTAFGHDKLVHLFSFAVLVLPASVRHPRALLWLGPAAILFGGAIEIIQPFVGREREGLDFLADSLGVGLGAIVGLVIHHYFAPASWHRNA